MSVIIRIPSPLFIVQSESIHESNRSILAVEKQQRNLRIKDAITDSLRRAKKIEESEKINYKEAKLKEQQLEYVKEKRKMIIQKAKKMGYIVEEKTTNNAIKLVLVKRSY